MAIQTVPGRAHAGPPQHLSLPPAFTAPTAIAATGEKVAFIGRFWHKDRAAKTVTRTWHRWGSVTKAGGSALTISLQTVSSSAGPGPPAPDETQDQTVAVANGDAGFASNTAYRSGALSGGGRSLAHGEYVAWVVEYDGAGRLGSDSVGVSTVSVTGTIGAAPAAVVKTGGAWGSTFNMTPNLALECSDGTFGCLEGGFAVSAVSSAVFNSGSSPNRYAQGIYLPHPMAVDGLWASAEMGGAASDFELRLYEGTTLVEAVAQEANMSRFGSGTALSYTLPLTQARTLAANTQYYVALVPTTANNLIGHHLTVADAGHLQVWQGGPACHYAEWDGSAWVPTTTRAFLAGVVPCGFDDATGGGGGGGLLIHPGMGGGIRG